MTWRHRKNHVTRWWLTPPRTHARTSQEAVLQTLNRRSCSYCSSCSGNVVFWFAIFLLRTLHDVDFLCMIFIFAVFSINVSWCYNRGGLVVFYFSTSFCPTDAKFATCSDDGTVRVWDFLRCHEERILRGTSLNSYKQICIFWLEE